MLHKRKTNKKGKPHWVKIIVALVAFALLFGVVPSIVQADKSQELVVLPNGNHGKREVVYAKLGVEGQVDQVFVVNHFHPTSMSTLVDHGDYSSVVHLTGDVAPVLDGSTVTVEGVEGRYFYQGNLNTSELPWIFDIVYRLDNEVQDANELSGVTGKIEMELNISRNDDVDSLFFDQYALQIGIPINPDRIIVEAATEGFLVSTDGLEQQMNYIILPGQETTIKLVMDVNDFAMGQITIAGVLMSFDIDASEMESEFSPLGELEEGIDEFAEGALELQSGFTKLQDAFIDVKNGAGDLVSGSQSLNQGLNALTKGSEQLLTEGAALKTGSAEFLSGLKKITDNLPSQESLVLPDLPEFDEATLQQLAMMDPQLAGQIQGMLEMFGSYAPLLSQFGELSGALKSLQTGYAELHGGIGNYVDQGVGGIVVGLKGNDLQPGLSTGAAQLAQGVSRFKKGLDDYNTSGLSEFSSGIGKLADGAVAMRDETSGMRDMFEEKIEEMLDEFANVGFKPVSFVSEKNEDVSSVQFVFMTGEIPPISSK